MSPAAALPPDDAELVETFKRATAGCVRAIAGRPEVEVGFSPGTAAAVAGERVQLPVPAGHLDPALVPRLRGIADAAALKLRYHDERIHGRFAPLGPDAARAFDALESARTKALGALALAGVRENLASALDGTLRAQGLHAALKPEHVPVPEALHCAALARFLAGDVPPPAAHVAELWEGAAEAEMDHLLDVLSASLADQAAFARAAR